MDRTRAKGINWIVKNLNADDGNIRVSAEDARLSVLMDIRDELKDNNQKLQVIIEQNGWSGSTSRELRGLRRDLKKRCHKKHVEKNA